MKRKFVSKIKTISVAAFFAAIMAAAIFSCSNLQDGAQDNAHSNLNAAYGAEGDGQLEGVATLCGSVEQDGIVPQEFTETSADSDDNPKSIFPTTPSSGLSYTITATATINSTAVSATGKIIATSPSVKYSIDLPYASGGTTWSVKVEAKTGTGSSAKTVLSKTQSVTVSSATSATKNFTLEYVQDSSVGKGSIVFTISCPTTTGVSAIKVFCGSTDTTGTKLTLSSGSASYSKTSLTPGVYDIKIIFYSDTSATKAIYAIAEKANVYSNLDTNKFVGTAGYISSGAVALTKTLVDSMNSIAVGGIWLGGTGIVSGSAASDTGDGSKFAPVATLYKAFQIANDLASVDSSKTYTINVQGNVDAGTSSNKTATLNSTAKVALKGTNTSTYYKISGGTTAGTYKISSSSSSLTCNYLTFDKLSNIQVAAGTLTIDNSSVTNATNGGFLVSSGATLKSTQGLTISACTRADGGGGIYSNGTLTLTGTEISGCKAPTGGSGTTTGCGGAMIIGNSSGTATLTSCTIGAASPSATASSDTACSNYAANLGGGIYVLDGATVTLGSSAKVQYNYAGETSGNGGGIYINNGTLTLTGGSNPVTIGYNGAKTNGGGLYISSSCTKAIELKGNFYKNSATNGGAIYTASTKAVTTPTSGGPTIGASGKANTATYGGGIYIASTGVSFANAVISYNTATNGAGVYISSSGGATFANGGSITNCTASSYGGGIYNKGSLYLCGAALTSNKAATYGGGIWSDSKVCLYNDSSGNSTTISLCQITATTGARGGGGVYVAGGGLYLGYSEYTSTTKTEKNWSGAISKNTAYNGAGVYVAAGTLMMSTGTIGGASSSYANTASASGAGIYVAAGGSATLKGGTIKYNSASDAAGGVYDGESVEISGATIENNTASGSGGGVYVAASKTLTFTSGSIKGNTVTKETGGKGGGIYSSGSIFISGSAVVGGSSSSDGNKVTSTSGGMGGGIYCASGALYLGYTSASATASWTGSISANSISSTDGQGGGVYFASGGTGTGIAMASGTIGGATDAYANTATLGGAIYNGGNKTIDMGGAASIPPGPSGKNDIYLYTTNGVINITSTLTATAPVGLISIKSSTTAADLNTGKAVMKTTAISETYYKSSVAKFAAKQNLAVQVMMSTSGSSTSYTTSLKTSDSYVSIASKAYSASPAITKSKVFISGRSFTLPSIIACDHECTQAEYGLYCKYGGNQPSTLIGKGDDYPAYYVSWYDAIVYCNLRSMVEGLEPVYSVGGKTDPKQWAGMEEPPTAPYRYCAPDNPSWSVTIDSTKSGWRLPYEAEWEYLARNANLTNTNQYNYSGSNNVADVAWYWDPDTDSGNSNHKAHVVRTKAKTTTTGMYDMTGNVWEWNNDWYAASLSGVGLTGPTSGTTRQARHSGYNHNNDLTYRDSASDPISRFGDLGFRVVRNAP